ncbi:MAG: M42 family metallopeptidase [Dehalococcoidia bacterium]|nr:M42 family metallopeptidase [Dehalococcoidia bacterium]
MDEVEGLLKELTEAGGIPGHEAEVRQLVRKHLGPLGDISYDRLGSVICEKRGEARGPKIMLAAHMDEIGFLVSHITKEGFIRFAALGGWWDQVLLAQRVRIKTAQGDVIGTIGAKPPHLLSDEERRKLVEKDNMYIDIGATSSDEVEKAGVRIADPIVPVSEFTVLASGRTYLSKAFDDRGGCAVMIAVTQRMVSLDHPNTLFAVATVQEEVGLRGAKTSVTLVNPDVAIVLEGTAANDMPGASNEGHQVLRLGGGPVVTFYRGDMIPNRHLRDLMIDIARKNAIPLQIRADGRVRGGTDGAAIHLHGSGVPTVVLSLPVRYVHSHGAIMHRADFDAAVELLTEVIRGLDQKTVTDMTAW